VNDLERHTYWVEDGSGGEVCVPIHRHGRNAATLASVLSVATAPPPARAGDWPQLWGPTVTASVEAASPGGSVSLRELWRRPIGSGFSAITVVGERGYTGESDGTSDHAIAFDVRTGRTLWRAALGETYRGHDFLRCIRASDGGAAWKERTYPGSVALVDGHLVALSITAGLLRVVEANPQAYRERARLQVLEPGSRAETPPSVVGRRIFLRNDEEVVAVDVE
jgi:outer membrane protein assembly factor BamB